MRQAGVVASAGLIALTHGPSRLHEDHENARRLAERLALIEGLEIDLARVQTNIVIFGLTTVSSQAFLDAIEARGLLAVRVDENRVRMVTHVDASRQDIDHAAEIVEVVMKEKNS